jgi:hypothetical protein
MKYSLGEGRIRLELLEHPLFAKALGYILSQM